MDLNGDGHVDLLTGSWPGELHFFRGGPGRTFAASEVLKDKAGRIINPGGGVKKHEDGTIEIVGDAKFEEADDSPTGGVVIYQGQRIVPKDDKLQVSSTGNASAVHAVDWDGDGDLDLLVGNFDGHVYFIPNEGTASDYSFGKERLLEVSAKPLKVAGDAGPFVVDWNGDGVLDLLVGDGDGAVSLFLNVGSKTEPKLAAAEKLVAPGQAEYGPKAPAEPTRGIRSKVCVTDWNGDGFLDLLVGDMAYLKPPVKPLTDDEQAKHDALREEIKPLAKRRREILDQLSGKYKVRDKTIHKRLVKERDKNYEQLKKLQSQLPPAEIEDHGWVWLFLRKPIDR